MSTSKEDNIDIFQQLEEYPWAEDAQFQGGLSAILGSASSPMQIQELTLRAQCFYLSRKKSVPIDFDAYKAYLASKSISEPEPAPAAKPSSPPAPEPAEDPATEKSPAAAPYPPTFAEIVELITSGAPIPGIRDIPATLLTSQASKASASKRKKPWEKDEGAETAGGEEDGGSKADGTFGDHRDEVVAQDIPEE